MRNHMPVQVMILDGDSSALYFNKSLLMKDKRTTVCATAEDPGEALRLISGLKSYEQPEIMLIEAGLFTKPGEMAGFLEKIRSAIPAVLVLCLSQSKDVSQVVEAIYAKTNGYLLKNDLRVAVASAVLRADAHVFWYSAGVEKQVWDHYQNLVVPVRRLQAWQPNPSLTRRLYQMAEMRLIYGMSAEEVARQLSLAPGTIEKYVSRAYQVLENSRWAEDDFFNEGDWITMSRQDQAFMWFTALPRKLS